MYQEYDFTKVLILLGAVVVLVLVVVLVVVNVM